MTVSDLTQIFKHAPSQVSSRLYPRRRSFATEVLNLNGRNTATRTETPKIGNMTLDPTTQANYTQIASEHIDFDWSIDFGKKLISGSATHTLVVKEADVKEVM